MRQKTLTTVALGLLAGSTAVEIGLRLVELTPLWVLLPVAEVALYGPDPNTGYAHRAGVTGVWTTENRVKVTINSLGLRDRLCRTIQKPAGSRRWAIVGDSYVEALQVPIEATFPALAELALTNGRHGNVEVVNLGLAGAGPAVIVERLRAFVDRLSLDGAVVVLDARKLVAPSLGERCEFPEYVLGTDGAVEISHSFRQSRGYALRTGAIGDAIYWACDNVRLARVLNNRKNVGLFAELKTSLAPIARNAGGQSDCDDAMFARHKMLWGNLQTNTDFATQRLNAVLEAISSVAEVRGIPVIITVRDLPRVCPVANHHANALSEDIVKCVHQHGLSYLDLDVAIDQNLPLGRHRGELRGFGVHEGSGHLNEFGHEVFAMILADVITEAIDQLSCTQSNWKSQGSGLASPFPRSFPHHVPEAQAALRCREDGYRQAVPGRAGADLGSL